MAKRRSKGEGSIFRERDSAYWCAQITLPDGSRRRKRSKKQQVVKEWLLQQRQDLQKNIYISGEKTRFDTYLDRFLKDVADPTLKPKTVSSYRWLINKHIKPNLGHLTLNDLRPDHLQSLYSKKLEEGLSKRSVQHMHAVIRRSLNQALKWDLIYRNPASLVTAPTPDKQPPNTFTGEHARQFLASVQDHRWYSLYVLAITTGMRRGEILGLTWEAVDFEQGTLSIHHTVQYMDGRIIESEPKTSGSRRTIAMPDYTSKALKDFQRTTGNKEGLVYRTSTGRPISGRNVTRHFHLALERAELPRMRFHDLRHTAATLLLKENVHPKVVQEMLGHSTIMLTLDTYSHILPSIQQEATEKMDKIFG